MTGAKESRQLIRVAAIGLDLVGSLLRNERRGDDLADKSLVAQMAAEDETARAGFVSKAQLDIFRSEFLDQFVDGVQRAADNAVTADLGGVLGRDGNGDGFFVDVQAEVMDDFIHGCLVSLLCYQ